MILTDIYTVKRQLKTGRFTENNIEKYELGGSI